MTLKRFALVIFRTAVIARTALLYGCWLGQEGGGLGVDGERHNQVGAARVLVHHRGRLTPHAQAVLHELHHVLDLLDLPGGGERQMASYIMLCLWNKTLHVYID